MGEQSRDRVSEIIEQVRRTQSRHLDLQRVLIDGPLTEIPGPVFELTWIERLNLRGNNICVVSERIRELPNLKYLNVTGNPIERLPNIPGLHLDWSTFLRCRKALSSNNITGIVVSVSAEGGPLPATPDGPHLCQTIAELAQLRSLGIESDSLFNKTSSPEPSGEVRELISELSRFPHLECLLFVGVLLGRVPDGIRSLRQLRTLGMSKTRLDEVPDWLGELGHLRCLTLMHNNLTRLPDTLASLRELEWVSLDSNPLTEIPSVLFRIPSLTWLGLTHEHGGGIKQIPPGILQLPSLESLFVLNQPIEVPPPEVVKEGVEAIKNYWRQQEEVGVDYLCEAKLIIVGEAGAGKTTLAKKIKDARYELQAQEESTEGIDVIHWSFPCAIRIKRDGREELHHADFRVSIWDFGGQEIYHATHQFFLTRRSLYALVADDRKEDTDFNYWLQVVELLSDRSPLVIVRNEKQDRQRDMDLGALRSRFPNLKEAFRTNLATNRGLDDLVRVLRNELERLPHIGTPLPKTWSRVRAALEHDVRDYISLDEYLAVCQDNGFTRREDKLQLSGYLHDLGICLHFQDDPVLKKTIILKPRWGTDAVYRVLDDHTVLDNRGRFGPSDLTRIWSEEKYASMQDELLRLMMRFQLCYQLPDAQAYIAPQLLSSTRPAHKWDSRGGLVLRYDYEFMPKGIVTRLIVALNHLIADQGLVWKSGVIFAREDTRAEVIEDYDHRRITVRVNGADSRGLLAIVDDRLERIHASFPRLRYDRFLPCNCEVCRTREEPYAYSLTELKDFASHGDQIQCRSGRKLVDAAALIRDVLPSAVFSPDPVTDRLGIVDQVTCRIVEPAPLKEVFVSYAWADESTAIVDKLQEALKEHNIRFIRDKDEIKYRDSIRDFMKGIGRGKCIVVVLSKKYLESKSCMFEMTEIADRWDIRNRVFPIVLADTRIYEAVGRLRYIKFWEQKKNELDSEMKAVSGEYLVSIREELDLFAKIRGMFDHIVDVLADMNALTPEQHKGSNFDILLQSLDARLSE